MHQRVPNESGIEVCCMGGTEMVVNRRYDGTKRLLLDCSALSKMLVFSNGPKRCIETASI